MPEHSVDTLLIVRDGRPLVTTAPVGRGTIVLERIARLRPRAPSPDRA
ncbi:MAG TPA: hypothetical protein VN790_05975 [Steroidobacteraceae bacterium]|nr:hypothetical protein [Steroidobacteraceae bacterium]